MFSYPSLSVSTEMMVVYTTKKDITHLWYGEPNAVRDAIGYAKYRSRSDKAVIRVYELLHIPGPFSGVTNQAGKTLTPECARQSCGSRWRRGATAVEKPRHFSRLGVEDSRGK